MMTEYTKKPFRCARCKAELGQTEGIRLYCGNAIFALKVTVTCALCGEIRVWRPILPKEELTIPPKNDVQLIEATSPIEAT